MTLTIEWFVPMLAMVTLGGALIGAWRGSRKVAEMREDPEVPRSALAEDGDPHHAQTDLAA